MKSLSVTALNYYTNKHGDVTNKFFHPNSLSSLASARLQMLPCLTAVKHLGGSLNILSFHSSNPSLLNSLQPVNACVVGKLTANSDALIDDMAMANLAAITRLKNIGSKIIVLYSDHHLSRSTDDSLHRLHQDLFCLADHIIYPSQALLELSEKFKTNNALLHVIHDPWQISKQYAHRRLNEKDTVRIIWFGGGSNLQYLTDHLKELISSQPVHKFYELTILTNKYAIKDFKLKIHSLNINAPNWIARFETWSNTQQPMQLENELRRAHIAIIPSDPKDPIKMGASHNRVVDSARAGCLVLASPMQSYLQLQDICMISENISSDLTNAIYNYEQLAKEKNINCSNSLQSFCPSVNLEAWKDFWKSIMTATSEQ